MFILLIAYLAFSGIFLMLAVLENADLWKTLQGGIFGLLMMILGMGTGTWIAYDSFTSTVNVMKIDGASGQVFYEVKLGTFSKTVQTQIQVLTAEQAGIK